MNATSESGGVYRPRYRARMRRWGWVVFVIAAGLAGATIALCVLAGLLPAGWSIVSIAVVPVLCFWAAFFGLMASDSIPASLMVGLTTLVLPVLDVWIHSELAGNFDDARGYGIATGLGITTAAIIALAVIGTRKARTSQSEMRTFAMRSRLRDSNP